MHPFEMDRAAFSWFTRSWDDYVSHLPLVLAVNLVLAVISAGSFLLINRTHSLLPSVPYTLFVLTPFTIGANLVYIKIARGAGASFKDLFSAFPVYHRAIAVSLLLGLASMGGLFLFIVPGVMIYLAFMFSEYAVVDRRTGVKGSFALSAAITNGWKLRLFPLVMLTLAITMSVPDVYVVAGSMKAPTAALDLKPWTIMAAVLKTFVFLPWLGLALARAYTFLLALAGPEADNNARLKFW